MATKNNETLKNTFGKVFLNYIINVTVEKHLGDGCVL